MSSCPYPKGPKMAICPFTMVLFATTAALYVYHKKQQQTKETQSLPTCQVVFVLGGPGAGKGTQCTLLAERLHWTHLSAGDLLRAARKDPDNPLSNTINDCIANGQLVPSEVTCALLQTAMEESYNNTKSTKFLIDGFPRSHGNASAWNETMAHHKIELVLLLECPEEVLTGRLLERGRGDDELAVIRRRFETYRNETAPILKYYDVQTVRADAPIETVYQQVFQLVEPL